LGCLRFFQKQPIQPSEYCNEIGLTFTLPTLDHYLEIARSVGAGWRRIPIIIPGALNWVRLGLHLNVSFALMGAFVGDFISSEQGLGHYIMKASSFYDTTRVLLGILILSLIALTLHHHVDCFVPQTDSPENDS